MSTDSETAKTVVPKFKPDTSVWLAYPDDRGPDIFVGESVHEDIFVIVQFGRVGRAKAFHFAHRLTGLIVNRGGGRSLEGIRAMIDTFWERCPERTRQIFAMSSDPKAIRDATPREAYSVLNK